MTKSKIFLYFCLSFIIGIFLNSIIAVSQLFLLGFLILGILLISVLWQYKKIVVIGFCLLFLVLGVWRHQTAEFKIINDELRKFNDLEEKIILIGKVSSEPDIREKSMKLSIKVENISPINQSEDSIYNIKGKVLITISRYSGYQYGDKLKIIGFLKTPEVFEDFNYKDYLSKNGVYSVMYFPEIELLVEKDYKGISSLIYAQILGFKNKLRESIYQNLSPPQSSILGAMILGDKRKISEKWKEKLNIAGVRHITAVSGLHVAILTTILMTLLIALGFWRQQSFYFTIILIAFFIIMTGLQPSAVRAGIMGSLFLLGQYLGRLSVSSRAILFAAALMLIQNPLLLRQDIGFQLSFLAMFGIIYLLPVFKDLFKFIPGENLKSILAMTFSAYLFTLPVLIYNFGLVSLVAPLTNVLIVPLLYWIMIFGFIFGLIGMISSFLGWIFSWPAWLLLTYLIKTVDWFSSFSQAALFLEISWIWIIVFYLILGLIILFLHEKQKLKFLDY